MNEESNKHQSSVKKAKVTKESTSKLKARINAALTHAEGIEGSDNDLIEDDADEFESNGNNDYKLIT